MTCFILLIFLIQLQVYIIVDSVQVKVEQGWLRGEIKTTSTNIGKYYSFKGIPYAAPPLGRLRFKEPQPPLKWKDTRNATEHCDICTQPVSYTNRTVIGNEDCLCLNVYTPNLNPDSLLPVMFFIHGGLFIIGSGNSDQFGPDFLMPHDVVLVTVNYRLGAFGFLAVETEEIPGNAGLKDTVAALKWLQKNIQSFGGNPDCVTIFGQSVGAAIVGFHVLAPFTKNLFKKAIFMSGSFFNDWTIAFDPRRRAFAQGRVLGLDTNDPYKLTEFLQSVPAKDLIQVHPNVLLSDEVSTILQLSTYYPPNVERKFGSGEGQFLTSPTTLLCNQQVNKVDVMIGYTASEGSGTVEEMEEVFLKYYSSFRELLVPLKITYFRSPKKVLELADCIKHFYFKNKNISRETILDLIKFYTYNAFVVDIHNFIEKLPQFLRIYRYKFAIYSSRNVYARLAAEKYGIKEATHSDDLAYLFDGSFYNQTIDVNSKVFQYIQLMCKLYTNFAKYGNPTPDDSLGITWPEYNPNKSYVTIGRNGTLTTETISLSNSPNLKFWHNLYQSTGIDIY